MGAAGAVVGQRAPSARLPPAGVAGPRGDAAAALLGTSWVVSGERRLGWRAVPTW